MEYVAKRAHFSWVSFNGRGVMSNILFLQGWMLSLCANI